MHTYLATVAQDLASGGTEFGDYYSLRGWVTPYALSTYAMAALDRLFDPMTSEKVGVCLTVLLLFGGFWALASAVSTRPGACVLLVCPLALHKSVFLGFQNFCAAIGIVLMACALWCRLAETWRWWKSLSFACLVFLLGVTHPIGVLVLGLFVVVHLAVRTGLRIVTSRSLPPGGVGVQWSDVLRQAGHLGLFVPPLLFIGSFTTQDASAASVAAGVVHYGDRLVRLAMFGPVSAFQTWYYAAPHLFLVVGAAALIWTSLRSKQWARTESASALACLVVAAILTATYVTVPEEMGGAAHFDQRFPIFALVFLIAAAADNRAPARWHAGIGAVALIVSAWTFAWQASYCIGLQNALGFVVEAPRLPPGRVGILAFEGPRQVRPLSFSPTYYGGAYYLLRSRAVLLNAPPWLNHSVMLVRPIERADSSATAFELPAKGSIRLQNPETVMRYLMREQRPIDFLLVARATPLSGWSEVCNLARQRGLVEAAGSPYFILFIDSRDLRWTPFFGPRRGGS
jgi:hypothetical protein